MESSFEDISYNLLEALGGDVRITGGTVRGVTYHQAICAKKNVSITGGEISVRSTGEDWPCVHVGGSVLISGGQTVIQADDAYGIRLDSENSELTLSWTGPADSIYISSAKRSFESFPVTLANVFTDVYGNVLAAGDYNSNDLASKTLRPYDGMGVRMYGNSISLDGDIAVNFYMELSETILQSANAPYMQFTVPDAGEAYANQKVFVRELTPEKIGEKDVYVFKCRVAAKNMTSKIRAQLIDGTKEGTIYIYSVKDYADYLLANTAENAAFAAAASLVRAMLHYGAAAQAVFGSTNAPANAGIEDTGWESVTAEEINRPSNISDDLLPAGTTFDGATLTLRAETTLSLYFKSSEPLQFSCDGMTVEKAADGETQVARIRNIPASRLSEDFTLKINGSHSVTYSPLTYCYKALLADENTYSTELRNTAKTLYKYAEAANKYFKRE